MSRSSIASLCFFALVFAFSVPCARASQWNQATKVTVNEPVEIPGSVLTAGTYWFTVLPDDPNRNVVQVWNSSRQHLIATLMTVPDYRMQPTGKTVIKFKEQPSNQPEALRAWFYPGDNYGHAFVYSETQATKIAKRTGEPVLAMRDDVAANTTKPAKSAKDSSVAAMQSAPIEAINSKGQHVDKSQAMQESQNQTASRH